MLRTKRPFVQASSSQANTEAVRHISGAAGAGEPHMGRQALLIAVSVYSVSRLEGGEHKGTSKELRCVMSKMWIVSIVCWERVQGTRPVVTWGNGGGDYRLKMAVVGASYIPAEPWLSLAILVMFSYPCQPRLPTPYQSLQFTPIPKKCFREVLFCFFFFQGSKKFFS